MIIGLVSIASVLHMSFNQDKAFKLIFGEKENALAKYILQDVNLRGKTIILSNDSWLGYILAPYGSYNLINYCECDRKFNYDVTNFPAKNKYCYFKDANKIDYVTLVDFERLLGLVKTEAYSLVMIEQLFKASNVIFVENKKHEKFKIKKYSCLVKGSSYEDCIYKIIKIN